jgi:hypothetical protein
MSGGHLRKRMDPKVRAVGRIGGNLRNGPREFMRLKLKHTIVKRGY